MNRRIFIFTAGSSLCAQTLPSKQVVAGLIGAGARGSELLHACLADPAIRIGAVCETFEPRMFEAVALARSKGHRTRYYRLYGDLIADKDVDAVIIATPDFWHHRMTLEAIRAGKDVYVEQPLSLTWQEGVEMAAAEGESRQIVQVGSQTRSSRFWAGHEAATPGRTRLAQAQRYSDYLRPGVLRRGGFKLSDPLNFVDWQAAAATQVPYSPDRFLNWRFYLLYGGGVVSDLGCPAMDVLHMLVGLDYPVAVKASAIRSSEKGFDTPERAVLTVEYPGMLASVSLDGAATRPDQFWSVDGGRIVLGQEIDAEEPETTRRHLTNFFDSVRTRKPPNASIRGTFPATLICQMANLSIATGHTAHWDVSRSQVESRA
jgi:predicted dehydrogenase